MGSKTASGKQVVKILCREFGFYFISQKGSHVKLGKKDGNREMITIVPLHKELARGTLKGVLDLGEVEEQKFKKYL
jgi:predicted RNA binding protein YcfA (HicA-like mRNA interferase family)